MVQSSKGKVDPKKKDSKGKKGAEGEMAVLTDTNDESTLRI